MNELLFLIGFPVIIAILMLFVGHGKLRSGLVILSSLVLCLTSIWVLITYFNKNTIFFDFPFEPTGKIMYIIEILLALFILYMGVKYKKPVVIVLALVQAGLLIFYETFLTGPHKLIESNLFIDQFSIIMALIIGIIGSLICVYALGYMETYHQHHTGLKDRRKLFFFILFIFLSAMFGLVFSNNLLWVLFFWEITTICSFVLIGYSQTKEATDNAFLALAMNLLGGIAFAGAIVYLAYVNPSGQLLELNNLLVAGQAIAIVPAVLICFAGITKAALMPFSSWLVGAMVAPTPVSALLHSSTMVKAGVYIIVRFSPVLSGSTEGFLIAAVGGFTFLLASAMAISQSNAKRVLAYSTIANLGLIVACAGIGSYQLMWAAILLIIFHAVAKSLLFLCVGTVENRIGSRDIDDMAGLIVRMPKLTILMFIGIAGMFLAPFGMLIAKWAAIEAFIVAPLGLLFVILLAFGGSITVFFWAKWMGKIISVPKELDLIEDTVRKEKWAVLYVLAGLTVIICLIFPLISSILIEPFILGIYGKTAMLSQDNVIIMAMMLFLLMIMPLSMLFYGKGQKYTGAYMSGMTTSPSMQFTGAMGTVRESTMGNYYLKNYFGEDKLFMIGTALCLGLVIFAGILTAAGVVL